MKIHNLITRSVFGAVALLFLFVSNAVAAVDAFIIFKSADGKETKVAIASDGTFTSPLAAGKYTWRMVCQSEEMMERMASAPASGSHDRESSAPSVSEIARIKVQFHWDRSTDARILGKTKPLNISLSARVQTKRSSIVALGDESDTLVVDADGDTVSGTIQFVTNDGTSISFKEFTTSKEQLEKNPRH